MFTQESVGAQLGPRTHVAQRADDRACADLRPGPDHGERPDRDILADLGRGIDQRLRMDARGKALAGIEDPGQPGHGHPGARGNDRGLKAHRLPVGTGPDDGGPCGALRQGLGIFRGHGQRQIARPRAVGFRRAGDLDRRVAFKGRADCRRDISDSVCHLPPAR